MVNVTSLLATCCLAFLSSAFSCSITEYRPNFLTRHARASMVFPCQTFQLGLSPSSQPHRYLILAILLLPFLMTHDIPFARKSLASPFIWQSPHPSFKTHLKHYFLPEASWFFPTDSSLLWSPLAFLFTANILFLVFA